MKINNVIFLCFVADVVYGPRNSAEELAEQEAEESGKDKFINSAWFPLN